MLKDQSQHDKFCFVTKEVCIVRPNFVVSCRIVYKFELKNFTDILVAPKNIGRNK